MGSKLRIGLLLVDRTVPQWAFPMVENISDSDRSEVVLLLLDGTGSGGSSRKVEEGRCSLLYRLHERMDNNGGRPERDALRPTDLPSSLKEVREVHLQVLEEERSCTGEYDQGNDPGNITDILIDLRPEGVRRDDLYRPRYGTWHVALGDQGQYPSAPPGFWEVFDRCPVTVSDLRMRDREGEERTIYRSYSHTITRSVRRNRDQSLFKAASFVPRKLRDLQEVGDKALYDIGDRGREATRTYPSNVQTMRFWMGRIPMKAGLLAHRLWYEERWAVRFKMGEGLPTSYDDFSISLPPPHTWWGDPQVFFHEGDHLIFVEELTLPRSKHHGHISMIRVDSHGKADPPVKVLERPYHLSFPHVFSTDGQYYMVPESSNNRSIELYEAVEFPTRWQLKKTLMSDVFAVDTTLLRRDGRWWMFTNVRENQGASVNDELFLFSADDLLSDEWEPHPRNPIVSDARRARPAGALFEHGGELIRPAQDCSRCYGYAVSLNKVVALDMDHYEEVPSAWVRPQGQRVSRVHTYNHLPRFTVIDTYMAISRLRPGR